MFEYRCGRRRRPSLRHGSIENRIARTTITGWLFQCPRTDGWDAGDHEPIRPLSMARKPVPFEVRLESDDEIIALQSALSEYWEIQTDVHVGERVLRRGWTVTLPNKKRLQHTKSVWDLQAGQTINVSIYIRSR